MEVSLKDKTVVVTGGAEGIGYSIAENFSKQSAKVIIVDINDVKGKAAVEQIKNGAVFINGDLRTESEAIFKEIIENHKRVDVLVNNAGVGEDDVQKAIDINFTASVTLSLKFCEHMSSNGGGTIINISSILGYRVAPFVPVYQATKSALIAFSRALGHETNYTKSGVKVLALCPGFTKTPLSKRALEDGAVPHDLLAFMKSHTWQDTNIVGDAALKIFKTAASGSVWLIEGGKLEEIKFQY